MTLTLLDDPTAADWIVHADVPWERLVCLGPDGFGAYARLRLLPDPAFPGQSENDVDAEDWRDGQLPALFATLAGATGTPDDCYFCVWEGLGQAPSPWTASEAIPQPDAVPGLAPHPPAGAGPAPAVRIPHRAYWLFRGPLADLGRWDEVPGLDGAEPAFVWPADRAWCVARDVDPHFAGVGGDPALIARLVDDARLDVVAADPAVPPPAYR